MKFTRASVYRSNGYLGCSSEYIINNLCEFLRMPKLYPQYAKNPVYSVNRKRTRNSKPRLNISSSRPVNSHTSRPQMRDEK